MTIIGDGEQTAAGLVNQVPGGSTVTGTASDLGLLARKRQGFDSSGDETTYDPTQVGGGGQTIHYGSGNGQGTLVSGVDPNTSELNRYRSMGEAAAARQAYQVNFGKSLGDESQGFQDRNSQILAASGLRNAAEGNAPSQAAILGNQAAGQSLEAQMAAAANGRGGVQTKGSIGAAAAQSQAAQMASQQQLGNVAQYSGMRGAEMQHAQQSYGAAGGTMRTGDYAQQGMAQQRAEAQGQSEFTQRQLNQQGQMGYEQMGINNQQAESDGALRQAAMTAQSNADATSSHDARNARNLQIATSGMQAVGTLGMGSDERMKQGVMPLYEPPGSELRMSDEGRGYLASNQPDVTSGASLSGPTPKYSSAQPAAPKKPSMAATAAKAPRKLTDAELDKLAAEMKAHMEAQNGTLGGPSSVQAALERDAVPPPVAEPHYGEDDLSLSDERTKQGAHGEPDMGHALEQGFKPFEYEYKPGFAEQERQAPGEKNIGPMAQDMAKNPITGSAVKEGPQGLLVVDIPKATKVNSAGIGYLAARQRELEQQLAQLKGGRHGAR